MPVSLLLICAKQYVYVCKSMQNISDFNKFTSKVNLQWKVKMWILPDKKPFLPYNFDLRVKKPLLMIAASGFFL